MEKSEFITVDELELDARMSDFGFDELEEAWAHKAAMLRWAPVLGQCLLQGQQLEVALAKFAVKLGVVTKQEVHIPAGGLLAKLKPILATPDFDTLSAAVSTRNKVVHGSLTVGLSRLDPKALFEEVGVDLWSYRGDISLIERSDSDMINWVEDHVTADSVEDWLRVLSAATRRTVELLLASGS